LRPGFDHNQLLYSSQRAHELKKYAPLTEVTLTKKWSTKMKLRNTLIATAALMTFPSLAFAEAFNGPYVGAQLGWDKHDTIGDGFSYGIIAGYNAKAGEKMVLGFEGNLDFSTAKEKFKQTVGGVNYTAEGKIGRELGIAARAGYLATPATLLYVKGGYENIRAKVTTSGNIPGFASLNSLKGNIDALVVGGGVEQALNEKTTFRLGYDYANGSSGYDRHRVLAGVAFHF
jgi:outer membrane immunogenic protein